MSNRRQLELPGLLHGIGLSLCLSTFTFFAASACAQPVTVTNVQSNHYHYSFSFGPGNCPSGTSIPGGQYPSTDHLERGHYMHHVDAVNPTDDYWVYWAHFDDSSYTLAEVAVFKSATECGPYYLQSTFQPLGWQSRDENIFQDDDGTGYLITASNDLGTNNDGGGYANNSMAIFRMTPDDLSIDGGAGVNWVFINDQREAPVVMKKDGVYFLVTSQAAGWFPSQGGYGVSTTMLTGWTPHPLPLGNAATFGGQTSDGFTIKGTQTNTYVLTFDHLGGNSLRDTGEIWLPLLLDSAAQTATLNWYPSWTVDATTGLLTLPAMTDVALGTTATSSAAAAANTSSTGANGIITYTGQTSYAVDGLYNSRWNAASGTTFPASLTVDLGSVQPIQEVDLSWYMVKGSEPYYKYTIGYSTDGTTYTTLDYTSNIIYGFTTNPVNFSARYVKLTETGYVCQNGCSFYGPGLWEMSLIQAPASQNFVPTVTVAPSVSSVDSSTAFTVAVNVSGPGGSPTPTGYIKLTGGGYSSDIYGLVNGANSFTIPAGAMAAGFNPITVTYTPDPTSASIYTLTPTAGTSTSPVTVGSVPAAPIGVAVSQVASGSLAISWNASLSATSYLVKRSDNGGAYSQVSAATTLAYTDTGLTNSTVNYCYTVAAVNGLGVSPDSTPSCNTATADFPPANLVVTQWASGSLRLTWTTPTSATSYTVKRSVDGAAFTSLGTSTTPTYTDTGLTNYTSVFCYTVSSVVNSVTSSDTAAVCNSPTANFVPVSNYSFETPSVPLWTTGPSALGSASWTFVGASGSSSGNNSGISNKSGTWTNSLPAPDGVQVAFLEGTGSITQTLGGFTPGQTYTITVAAEQRQTTSQSGPNPFKIMLNGTSIGTFTPSQSLAYYRDSSANFTATAASNTIAFVGTSSSGTSAVLLDNVRIIGSGAGSLSITPQSTSAIYGAASTVLTASATFSGVTAPSASLVFQIGNASQIPGSCSVSGNTDSCTVTYPTASLPPGDNNILVSYAGDLNYAANSASATLAVIEPVNVQLVTTTALALQNDGSYLAAVTVSNTGSSTAQNIVLTGLSVGAASGTPATQSLGSIAPGGFFTTTLSVPASAGAPGAAVIVKVTGTYTGGTFGGSARARLP